METTTMCFKIDGEWLTEFARTRAYEERNPRHALTVLVDGLGGFTTDNAISVLKGYYKLVGVNDLDYVAEEPEVTDEVQRRMNRIYGGCYQDSSGQCFQPYAKVTSWGIEDMRGIDFDNTYSSPSKGNNNLKRSLFYADDKENDLAEVATVPTVEGGKEDLVVLWRKVEIPMWVKASRFINDALEKWMEIDGNYLEDRGNHHIYKEKPVEYKLKPVKKMVEQVRESFVPNVSKNLNCQFGWVNLNGDFYPCLYMGHIDLANDLIEHILKEKPEFALYSAAEVYLENKGWVKLTTGLAADGSAYALIGEGKKPTKAQIKTIEGWAIENKVKTDDLRRNWLDI
jgi:hypothetical protein